MAVSLCYHQPAGTAQVPVSRPAFFRSVDAPGIASFAPSIVCLLLALQWGGSTYSWSSVPIILLLGFSFLIAVVFFCIELRRSNSAMLPLHLLKRPSILLSSLYAFSLAALLGITQNYVRSSRATEALLTTC